jgi:hypothetical protein
MQGERDGKWGSMSECMIMIPQLGYGLAATLKGSGRDKE